MEWNDDVCSVSDLSRDVQPDPGRPSTTIVKRVRIST